MDLILVRNVMIDFEVETKKSILAKLTRLPAPMAICCWAAPRRPFS